jgi:cytochrome c6
MKKAFFVGMAIIFLALIYRAYTFVTVLKVGEDGFSRHCGICHAGGGNKINPAKTLSSKDLNANSIKTLADIVVKIRNHRPGPIQFDQVAIPDEEAEAIAKYVLKTFK